MTEQINKTAVNLEEAQTEIRNLVKEAYLKKYSKIYTERLLKNIIIKATQDIKIKRLKESSIRSLYLFANSQRILWKQLDLTPELLLFIGAKQDGSKEYPTKSITRQLKAIKGITKEYGVPLQDYYNTIWKEKIKPILERLVKQVALDPNDLTGRNSLRNYAEMETRYQGHIDEIESLKERGVKIVACSSHQDCSDRCSQWQGRLYSLDGSTGVIDGHKYIPLEVATDVYYTTKAGITYKNGLLGFNCRHYLREYTGKMLMTVSSKERKRQYEITNTQRAMERKIRKLKIESEVLKGIEPKMSKKARVRARLLYEQYKEYSLGNNRAYYPMRINIK